MGPEKVGLAPAAGGMAGALLLGLVMVVAGMPFSWSNARISDLGRSKPRAFRATLSS